MPSGKGSKLLRYVEHRLRITLSDSRIITGTFLAFDKHLNLVLSDAQEFRMLKGSKSNVVEERQEKRNLGLIILRGENVVSIAVEGPPPPSLSGKVNMGGPGVAVGAGRGSILGAAPVGLGAAPIAGIGLGSNMMMPASAGAVQGMGRGMPPGMGRGMPPQGY